MRPLEPDIAHTSAGLAAPFDEHASVYAEVWDGDPIAVAFREELQRVLLRCLPAGACVLDAGCGIGSDARWLAEQGYEVVAIDASAGMVEEARQRGVDAIQLRLEAAATLARRFDAVLLDFGVVNCMPADTMAVALDALIAPGGRVVLVSMPRLHPSWIAARLLRGDLAGALSRLRPVVDVPVAEGQQRTRYWSAGDLRRALGPAWKRVEQRSLGALMPPPGSSWGAALDALERPLRALPLVRAVGDHVVLVMERESAAASPASSTRARPRSSRSGRRLAARWAAHSGEVRELAVLVLHLTDGCNSHCIACDFRGPAGGEALDAAAAGRLAAQARAMGCGETLLTGGEPLLRPDLPQILAAVRLAGQRITLLTNGLLLKRHAPLVARWCDEVVVSLDGHDADSYREARGIDGLAAVSAGVAALRAQAPGICIRARVTVSRANAGHLLDVARLGQKLGLDGISFLAPDLASTDAFGRDQPADLSLLPDPVALQAELAALRVALSPGFLTDSVHALDRIWQKIAADLGQRPATSPRCDAPYTSVVVQPDLSLRPCFFIAADDRQAHARHDLQAGLFAMGRQLAELDIGTRPECARCVCWAKLA